MVGFDLRGLYPPKSVPISSSHDAVGGFNLLCIHEILASTPEQNDIETALKAPYSHLLVEIADALCFIIQKTWV